MTCSPPEESTSVRGRISTPRACQGCTVATSSTTKASRSSVRTSRDFSRWVKWWPPMSVVPCPLLNRKAAGTPCGCPMGPTVASRPPRWLSGWAISFALGLLTSACSRALPALSPPACLTPAESSRSLRRPGRSGGFTPRRMSRWRGCSSCEFFHNRAGPGMAYVAGTGCRAGFTNPHSAGDVYAFRAIRKGALSLNKGKCFSGMPTCRANGKRSRLTTSARSKPALSPSCRSSGSV